MDPITTIGLVGSIANLITFTGETIQLVRSFKDGERELADLSNHLSLFEENLKGFDRVFRSRRVVHQISVETVKNGIDESYTTLKDLQKRLQQIARSESSTIRRMRWVQHKSSLERIDGRIKGQCAMLHSLVSVAQMEMMLAMCSQNPQLLEVCSNVAEEMARDTIDRRDLPILRTPTDPAPTVECRPAACKEENISAVVRNSVSSANSSDRSLLAPGVWNRPRQNSSSTSSSIGSSAPSQATSVFSSLNESVSCITVPDQEEAIQTPNPVRATSARGVDTEALVIRRACRFDCYCRCHKQTLEVTNDVFSRFNSPIFRQSKGLRLECSEPDCAGATSSQTRVLPSTFFHRAFSRLASMQRVRVMYNLNTYRMVPEGSDAIRYIKHDNLDKLKMCISSREATPWDTAPDGWSLLHIAVYARQLPTVKYLCDIGVDIDTVDLGARKPVDLAILKALTPDATEVEKEIVRIFAKDDDYLADYEFTPIHIAVLDLYDASDSERPKLEDLIEFVDNANNSPPGTNWARWKTRYQKQSPLYVAIIEQFRASALERNSTSKVIHNLLDQKDRKFHWTPLHWAALTNRADKMRILVENGADPFIQSNLNANIIHAAVESNALQSLAYALEISRCYPEQLRINQPNVWGESPLMMAAQGCLVDCVRLLLAAGADRAVRRENQQVALHYVGLSPRGDSRRQTVALLCQNSGQDYSHINAQDEDGRPPLFDFLDDAICVEELIRNGADLNIQDNTGKNVYHHVCVQDENESLRTLIRLCPSTTMLKQKDQDGNTPLIEALQHGSTRSAMILLDSDDIGDVYGGDGWAAVHYATKVGDPRLLEKVLQHSSYRKGMRTRDGKTAQVIAMESGTWCGQVKELLRKYNSLA
ncbi:ankyrin repeat protein [Aspergillus udagawae]|uniref:Ankyrin repeat protein n=1 Tax=Aspergillus udagawae TaxID=91492 RepID=A0ABQ1BF63_9EURO|nr:ankyrin repeat protein [Aspergillus udagawae]GFG00752.1 ankyrin repeat protein [Aspergillus udagawae]